MGPGRSFSLRIGDDSSAVAGSGRLGMLIAVRPWLNPETFLGYLLFPWIRIKGK